ncbi:MAG: ATP-dependent DNA helicase [Thermomicrobiales bacterium]
MGPDGRAGRGEVRAAQCGAASRRLLRRGPLRILAGAGTGKTQTLTGRFVHLVRGRDVPEHRILALTFSRKAAEGMRLRVLEQLPGGHRDLWIQTFHAFCLRLIGEWRQLDGLPPVKVVDQEQQRAIAAAAAAGIPDADLRAHRGAAGRARLAGDAPTLIDRAKDNLLGVDHVDRYVAGKEPNPGRLADLALAYRAYQRIMLTENRRGYGDLVMDVVSRLAQDPAALQKLRARFPHVLVDEFQDTNAAQFALLKLLVPPGGDLCVVGDPNQAIYAFRGGRSEYIEDFSTHFPGAKTFELRTNYRSGPEILRAANALIAHNPVPGDFELRPADGAPPASVQAVEVATPELEGELIARRILDRVRRPDAPRRFGDVAILMRSLKRSAGPIAQALTAHGIPFRMGGGATAEYDVVQDLLAALHLVNGPPLWRDAARLAVGRDGSGSLAVALRDLEGRFSGEERSALLMKSAESGLSNAETDAVAQLREVAAQAEAAREGRLCLRVYAAIRLSGHLTDAASAATGQFLSGVLRQAASFEEREAGLAEFLAHLAAGYDREDDEAPDDRHGVQILTVHAAKGLEWPVVFVAGLTDGVFPSPMRLDRDFDLDDLSTWQDAGPLFAPRSEGERAEHYLREERRLAYVVLTRGREEVHLTLPRSGSGSARGRSPFVAESVGEEAIGLMGGGLLAGSGPPASVAEVARRLRTRRQRALGDRIDGAEAEADLVALLLVQSLAGSLDGAIPVRDRLIPQPHRLDASLSFSFSQLDAYERCPRQYLYQKVLRLERDDEAASLAMGNAVHAALKALNERWRQHEAPPDDEEIDATIEAVWPARGFDCAPQSAQAKARARAMVGRYYAMERDRVPRRFPEAIETSFRAEFDAHRLHGRVDLVLGDIDGGVEIIDFKTGGRSGLKPAESLQLFLYDHAWRQSHPGSPPRVAFYGLRHDKDKGFATGEAWHENQALGISHDDESGAAMRARVDGLIGGVLANEFSPTPGKCCDRCSCRWLCPEG